MANSWYRTGTITVTNGSPTVSGSSTLFLGNINAGDMLFAPDGNQYEVVTVPDNVTLTIKQKNGTAQYLGSTLSGQAYSIVKTGPNNATVATQLTTLATNWQQDRDQYANWLGGTATGGDGSGNYPLTDAVGVTHNVPCPAKVALMPTLAVLTGYSSAAGTVAATDTVLQAINKLNGNDAGKMPLAGTAGAVSFGAVTAEDFVTNSRVAVSAKVNNPASTGYRNYKLTFGYNNDTSHGWVQPAYDTGVFTALELNPLGGNVLIGTTTDNGSGAKLQVNGWINASSTTNNLHLEYASGFYSDIHTDSAGGLIANASKGYQWFGIGSVEKMRLTSTGLAVTGGISASGITQSALGFYTQGNGWRPTVNYTQGFEILGDTQLRLWFRGSDGVNRSTTLTFS